MKTNYHTHTIRCNHANGSEEDYILAAIDAGYTELGFSDHSPWKYDSNYKAGMRMGLDEIDEYIDTLIYLRDKYKDKISIKIGLECEFFPNYMPWLKELLNVQPIDYIILGNHFRESDEYGEYYGTRTNSKDLVVSYVDGAIEAMKTGLYSYMAHPDVINYYDIESDFYKNEMIRLCKAAKQYNIPLEFNLLGFEHKRHYPNKIFWQIAANEQCDAILGIDAHDTYQFSLNDLYYQAVSYLDSLGINRVSKIKFLR